MDAWRLHLLGRSELVGDNSTLPLAPERRIQALVYIVSQRQWIAREQIGAVFWPGHAHEAVLRNVRKVLHLIGELPGPPPMETRGNLVRCAMPTDIESFEAALASNRLDDAVSCYRGAFAPGLEADAAAPFGEWLHAERARIAARWRSAVLQLAGSIQDTTRVLSLSQALIDADPFDEDAVSLALTVLTQSGRRVEARRLYRDFAGRLGAELGIEPSVRVRALVEETPAPSRVEPVQQPVAGIFVGRRLELRRISELLNGSESPRAVVLHGPGGIGKSRLSREVLASTASQFPDGAYWVALDDLTAAAQLPVRIAQAAGLDFRDTVDGVDVLVAQIGSRRLLLVLDNAEHLPELGALAAQLIARCPGIRLLVTSRARPSALDAEIVTLAGLDVPDEESRDEEAAASFDAVHLFVERARFQQPSFDFSRHLEAVLRIVRFVQGLPLAIEMAAAWVRLLPPEEIARELQGSAEVLTRDPAAGTLLRDEHASMRVVLERSFALLAPAEREAMQKIAVFAGGFTRDAVQAVADVSLPVLASLADKSLVQADRERGRFDLHPLVSAFARAQWPATAGLEDHVRRRHAEFFSTWLRQIGPRARQEPAVFRSVVEPDFENCRAAWHEALRLRADDWVEAMAMPMSNYLENVGRFVEGIELLAAGLAPGDGHNELTRSSAVIHRCVATLNYRAGRDERVELHARHGIRLARMASDTASLKGCLNVLGLSCWRRNQFEPARRYLEAALRQAEQDGDEVGIQIATANLGLVTRALGDFDESLRMLQRAIGLARKLGNARGTVIGLNNIGNHYRLIGDWKEAGRNFREGLALADRSGLRGLRANLLLNLALVEGEGGSVQEAVPLLEQVLALEERGAEPYLIVGAVLGMATVAARNGDFNEAFRRLADAVRRVRSDGGTFDHLDPAVVLAEVTARNGDVVRAYRLIEAILADRRIDAPTRMQTERLRATLPAVEMPDCADLPAIDLDAELDAILQRQLVLGGSLGIQTAA
jgi:predicted ATPase/DNA-binding SARP family transcriptional activator